MVQSVSDQLNGVLDQFENNVPHVEATAVVSIDGLVIASRLPSGIDEERMGAMGAAILSISHRSGEELNRGNLQRVLIQGDHGYMMIRSVGEDAVLVVLTGSRVKLGMLFYECKQCVAKLTAII